MATNYVTKTASLKATTADIRKVDAHEITVWTGDITNRNERANILDLISDSNVIYDDRGGVITTNDIWPNPITLKNTFITTDTKGNISINYRTDTYNTFDYSEMTSTQKAITKTAAKVIDNKVLDADGQLLMNWETAAFTNSEGSTMSSIFGGTDSQKAPITEWESDLSSLTNGSYMFYKTALTSFNGDLKSLTNARCMFYNTTLTSFSSDLSNLTNSHGMFYGTALASFNGDLSSLTTGSWMFQNCSNFTSFNSDLSILTNGEGMFYGSALESFNGDLSSMTIGRYMFRNTPLQSFNGNLSSLTDAYYMFSTAPLESFSGDLSSLTNGSHMFYYCKLNAESVHNIIHFINPDEKTGTDEGTIYIGTNIINDSTLEAQKLEFAKTCLCDSWNDLNAEFAAKHWTVQWQYNGSAASSASTLELSDSNISTALWAKLEEVTEDNEPYEYVSEDTNKHYHISWFHETNGSTDGYEYFGSLLEACGAYGVIPKEYAESNN